MKNQKENSDLYFDGIKAIAINGLDSNEVKLCKYWSSKYKLPMNDPRLLSLTFEELLLEYYQDIEEDKNSGSNKEEILKEDEKWLGETGEEYEKKIKKRLAKLPQVDLAKYKDNDNPEFEDDYK